MYKGWDASTTEWTTWWWVERRCRSTQAGLLKTRFCCAFFVFRMYKLVLVFMSPAGLSVCLYIHTCYCCWNIGHSLYASDWMWGCIAAYWFWMKSTAHKSAFLCIHVDENVLENCVVLVLEMEDENIPGCTRSLYWAWPARRPCPISHTNTGRNTRERSLLQDIGQLLQLTTICVH